MLNIRNIGISAHIDAGKTTLSERILFYSHRIHRIHEIKSGATLDHMELEQERGITIQSAATSLSWQQTAINLIDTPGHVDFTMEVERALRVLDGAVLVLCAVAGVQPQTMTVDRQMRRYQIPRIAFINKMDRPGAHPQQVLKDLRKKLGLNAALLQLPLGTGNDFMGLIDLITQEQITFEGPKGETVHRQTLPPSSQITQARQELIEILADVDPLLAEDWLQERPISPEALQAAIRRATRSQQFVPVLMGSAFKNKGVQPLLDAVLHYLPAPDERPIQAHSPQGDLLLSAQPTDPLVALAFKQEETRFGAVTWLRIYQGHMQKGDTLFNARSQRRTRIPRLLRIHAGESEEILSASAGDIVGVIGLDCATGDTLNDGQLNCTLERLHIPEPVVSIAIRGQSPADEERLSKALARFCREDPSLKCHRDSETQQTLLSGMGELQLEVYCERIRREYECNLLVGKPEVAYREAIRQPVHFDFTYRKQTGGPGQYARLKGYLEPSETPFEFINSVVGGSVPESFLRAAEAGFAEALQQGCLRKAPVMGVRVVIQDGATHPVDSSERSFQAAARQIVRDSLPQAAAVLMEPLLKASLELPSDSLGAVLGHLARKRAIVQNSQTEGDSTHVEAEVPAADMFGYMSELRSLTRGSGTCTLEPSRYAMVH